ncbi:hypothetical protein [uncultured Imperialibacter sp.]|uniref:hypothetical protein n=1 Tax=uncultured Imperialibacter sp. TaxID=1672639 RepID=UPI0030DDB063|tara:strand:- start:1036 stop:1629 length:594 start_codon:yes stop_codon:yes gene_type:complete
MKITRLTFLILLVCSSSAFAQQREGTKAKLKTRFGDRLALKADYFGELVLHPGLTVGMDYTVAENKWATLHWDTDLGGFWHRWNNSSVFLKTAFGFRLTIGSVFADINLGVGYLHSWAAGSVYQRAEEGGVEKAANWGHSHLMPNTSFLMGWDGSRRNNRRWAVHAGPEVYLQSSFNHIFLPHVAAKIGFTYKLNQK